MISSFSKFVTDAIANVGGVILANGRDNSFPGLTRLANGDLLMVYRDDPFYHASWRGKIYERTSSDEGATWSVARLVYDPPDNLEARDPEVCTLANGDVLMSCFRRWDNGFSLYSAERDVLRRTPEGAWSVLASGVNPTGYANGGFTGFSTCIQHACSGKIIELANGDLLWGIHIVAHVDSGVPNRYGVIRSTDGGVTWGSWQELGEASETGIWLDPDGTTLRLWNRPAGAWISINNGATWTFLGTYRTGLSWLDVKPSYAYDSNGALCIVYRKGITDNHVVGIAWSDDHGATWRNVSNLDATGQSMYASLVPNADGSIHVLYSRTRGSTIGSGGKKPVDLCFVTVTDPAA